jgi:hypothetical protein
MGGKQRREQPQPLDSFTGLREAMLAGEDGQPKIATLIAAGPNTTGTTYYSPDFLRRCVAEGRFSGSLMRANHPSLSEEMGNPEGRLDHVAGRTGDAFWDEQDQAVKAPIVLLGEDVAGSPAQLVKRLFSDEAVAEQAGLSIHCPYKVQFGDAIKDPATGRMMRNPVALTGKQKMFVDFVLAPAAGGRVPLLASEREESDEPMEVIADLTLDDLKTQRPDLIAEALREASPPEPPEAPPTTPMPVDLSEQLREALAPVIDQNKALTEKVSALQARLDQADGTSAVNVMIAEAGLREAEATMVRAELTGRAFDTPDALKGAFDAAVARIDQLLESVGAPAVRDNGPAADGTTKSDTTTAADLLRKAGFIPTASTAPKDGGE